MSRRRRRNNRADDTNAFATGMDQSSPTPIERMNDLMRKALSPRGLWGIGATAFAVSIGMNWNFYREALSSFFEVDLVTAIIVAAGLSITTTYFECYPVARGSAKSILEDIFVIASRPRTLPRFNGEQDNVHGKTLTERYRKVDQAFDRRMQFGRYFCFGLEFFLGVLAIGSIAGGGLAVLWKLAIFVFSVLGAEWGVSAMVQAGDKLLSPEARQAMNRATAQAKTNLQ